MQKLNYSRLELTMAIAMTKYTNGVWTLEGNPMPEEGMLLLIYSAFPEYGEALAQRAIEYIKTKWNGFITKDTMKQMNEDFMAYEAAYVEETRTHQTQSTDDKEDARFYCFLGELYDNKGKVRIANYWFQRAAMLGDAEGEGRMGLSYHRGYGIIPEDLRPDNVLEVTRWLDDEKAMLWLRRAQQHGWSEATRYIEDTQEEIEEREQYTKQMLESNSIEDSIT